jgi:sec-independent protein translocase protein TatC
MNEAERKPLLDGDGSLVEHLAELRFRLIRILWGFLIGMIACYNYTDKIFGYIREPIQKYLPTGGLVFTAPADKFIAHLKIAFFGGAILSAPWAIYHIWKFLAPGLYSKERKYTLGFIFSGSFLFALGVSFAYFAVFPAAFHFLMGYGGEVDKPMITIDQYLSFFTITSLMFGVSFELPLIIVLLGMAGVVSSKFLREKRRYAVVGMSVAAAIITPPDLLSMVMMLCPMVLLYESGLWIVYLIEKRRPPEPVF